MIYTQGVSWPCWYYAMLVALQKLWLNITKEQIFEIFDKRFKWRLSAIEPWARYLKSIWVIKDFKSLDTVKQIDRFLDMGIYLPVHTVNNLSFDSVRNPPFIQKFDWTLDHAFCLVENCWDKWKVQDSQGDKFADWWYWYIMKSDFVGIRKFARPVRLII